MVRGVKVGRRDCCDICSYSERVMCYSNLFVERLLMRWAVSSECNDTNESEFNSG